MSNRNYGDLSIILSNNEIITDIRERLKIFLNSYALYTDRWYEVTGDLLYEVICILKANNVYEMVDYRISVLKEIIDHATKGIVELHDQKDKAHLEAFISGIIDCFANKKNNDFSDTDFAFCQEIFNSTVANILIAINVYYLRDDWYKERMGSNKNKVLIDAMIVNYLIEVNDLIDENTTIEQLCLSFFSTKFSASVQQCAYEQYSEEFYKICDVE